jgi:hypothetical protein
VLSRLSGRRESSIFFLHQRQNNEQRYVPPPKQTITPTPLEVEAAPPLEPIIPVAATPSVTELHHVANSGGSAAQASRAWALVVGPQTLYTPCIFFQLFSPISKAHMSKDWALGLTHQSPISGLRPSHSTHRHKHGRRHIDASVFPGIPNIFLHIKNVYVAYMCILI